MARQDGQQEMFGANKVVAQPKCGMQRGFPGGLVAAWPRAESSARRVNGSDRTAQPCRDLRGGRRRVEHRVDFLFGPRLLPVQRMIRSIGEVTLRAPGGTLVDGFPAFPFRFADPLQPP